MATIKYFIKGKENPKSIYLRFVNGRKWDYTRNTGYLINQKDWHDDRRPIQRNAELKKLTTDLNDLSNSILKAFNSADSNEIDSSWLEYQIDLYRGNIEPEHNRSELLVDCIQYIIDTSDTRENAKGNLGLSKSRVNSYANLLKIIKLYTGKKKTIVSDVDVKFGQSFLRWMLNVQQYSESYARKKVDDLKAVCRDASIDGIAISQQLDKIKGGKPKSDFILYLSLKELKKIEKVNLISQSLVNARRWLLLGCQIGQRGTDLLRLTNENIVTRNELECIELTQQKTGKKILIPILDKTKELLKDGFPNPIVIQNFNEHIKKICEIAEINDLTKGRKYVTDKQTKLKRKVLGEYPKHELMSSHVCRRSFATNLYGTLPTPMIMQITGHSTEKMLLTYIGKGTLDYAQQIKDFYDLQKLKADRQPQLSIVKSKSS